MVEQMFKSFLKSLVLFNLFHVNGRKYSNTSWFSILMATPFNGTSIKHLDLGWNSFYERNCSFKNCYITDNATLLSDVKKFDVVLFDAVSLKHNQVNMPANRSLYQKYVLSSSKASVNYPISERYNRFFNWTWSYILDSDISCPSIVIKNQSDKIIGPKEYMHWMDIKDMQPTSRYVKHKLRKKKLAAAWIVPKCNTSSEQSIYVQQLQIALIKYGLTVDIFGECGTVKCLHHWVQTCYALVEKYYYFYLSFENSISFDYVTENLLIALHHFAVPVVYGGANYTRFMPDGIYLDALALGPERLAQQMSDIISDQNKYYEMFRWRRYYSYHEADEHPASDPVCIFCAYLNKIENFQYITMYFDIVRWFNDCKDWPVDQNPKIVPVNKYDNFSADDLESYIFQ